MPVFENDQTFGHPSGAFSNTNHALLAPTRVAFSFGTCHLPPEQRAELSPNWISRAMGAREADPWTHGFRVLRREDDAAVGNAAYKGPPMDGIVEIAYAIDSAYQNRGYATEAAAALVAFAFASGEVHTVRAHTLRQPNPSTRVLMKCGFHCVGDVEDPDDGPVWRWETKRAASDTVTNASH